MAKPLSIKKKRRRKTFWIILGSVVFVLLIFRLILPTIVLRFVNNKLDAMPTYKGHVETITMSLWRGAYQIQGITLNKVTGQVPVPFFSAQTIDFSVEWKALFHGSIVAKIIFRHPVLNFVKGTTEAQSQTKPDSSWVSVVKSLAPFKINRFEIINGEVHYRDFYANPKVDIFLDSMHAVATNLTNGNHSKDSFPSTVEMTTNCFKSAKLSLNMALDPFADEPTFALKEEMKGVQLIYLNDFLNAYANFKVDSGEFSLYTEIAASNGHFSGYTKPFFVHLKVDKSAMENQTVFKQIWASVVSAVGWVLTNPKKDQVATKIPISGSFEKPNIELWSAIGNLLRNAFIEALFPGLDNSIPVSGINDTPVEIKNLEDNSKEKKK